MKMQTHDNGLRLRQHTDGWEVSQVAPGSPADRVGLEEGDLIIKLHGHGTGGVLGPTMLEHLHGVCRLHVRDRQTRQVRAVTLTL